MTVINQIKDTFYPNEYSRNLPVSGELELCLMRKKGLARYCIAVVALDDNHDMKQQIQKARKLIKSSSKAMWLLKEFGAYIIFHTNADISNIKSEDLTIDKTSFHAVIIQGVHVIGKNNKHVFNHAKWFEHSFGDSDKIIKKLKI